jgi:hypothetical protein
MCLAARLLNVFAIPGEVFEVVKASPISVWNWLVPVLLLAVVGVFTVIVSQPALQKQLHQRLEQHAKALEQHVKEGKVKQAEADRALALARAIAQLATNRVLGAISAASFGIARVFWWAFLLWLLGRVLLKARFGFIKTLEIAGLGLMISVLGAMVLLLLMVNLPQLFSAPGLTMAVSDFDASRMSYLLLGVAIVFLFWLVGVLSVGLARLAGVPFLRAARFVFAAWVIQESCLVLWQGVLGQFVP